MKCSARETANSSPRRGRPGSIFGVQIVMAGRRFT
uniref:Uncharacterized protein n=1 Tax=Dulem virus 32 TaxID=3145750 RepID=A0AAU8B2L6_9CAUD